VHIAHKLSGRLPRPQYFTVPEVARHVRFADELVLISGFSVGGHAACRAVAPGSPVPVVGCSFLGSIGCTACRSGDAADAVDGCGEFCCPGIGFVDSQDQVAGSHDKACRRALSR
jgi:hypothetical protein